MDKRKAANQKVKHKLLMSLVTLLEKKEWSKITISELVEMSKVARVSYYRNFNSLESLLEYGLDSIAKEYHENKPNNDFTSQALAEYKFGFYLKHQKLVISLHRANAPISLLDIITDCMIEEKGDMSIHSISKYELYYYAGGFYNMVITWLESGSLETVKDMASEFIRLVKA